AYLINKASKGHYAMLGIEASPEALKELERNLGIHEDIVRSLTVRFETMDASPSVMMQQKSGESYEAA
ncbi:MAG: 30S ribosomal protein S6, partial [Alphaproteobacteria bacterium]